MQPFYLEKLSRSHYEDLLRQAEVERKIQAQYAPRQAWLYSLGNHLVRLGHSLEHLGEPSRTSQPHLLRSSSK
jgi:hypothetical protein